jgi:hypothetical protein
VTRTDRVRACARLGAAALGAAAISSYLLVAPVLAGTRPTGGLAQLSDYRTQGDPRVGLLVNVAGLYGFFRPGPTEPKNLFSGWPAVLAALLLIVAVGYVAVLRDAAHRRDGLAILAAGVAGYFLALGDQGPAGGLFRLAYEHVPGFVMMREPDKFAVLLALAYAYGFGWGITWLTTRGRQKAGQVAVVALATALPFAYTPNLLGGLGGQVKASQPPSSWSLASRLAGQATVLFLPWQEYFPTPFTGQRMIANPAAQYFAGTVLTSQDPGAGYAFAAQDPEHAFLDKVLGPPVDLRRARVALAGLGVRFVVLAKVADWRAFAQVAGVPGIRLVYSSPSLDLFSVRPTAQETSNDRRVRSVDVVDYRVLPGRRGVVALPVPYSPGWTLDGHPAVQLADGQAGILAPAGGGVVHYGPSGGVLASETGSLAAALAVAGVAFFERRRRALRRPDPDPRPPLLAESAQVHGSAVSKLGRCSAWKTARQRPGRRALPRPVPGPAVRGRDHTIPRFPQGACACGRDRCLGHELLEPPSESQEATDTLCAREVTHGNHTGEGDSMNFLSRISKRRAAGLAAAAALALGGIASATIGGAGPASAAPCTGTVVGATPGSCAITGSADLGIGTLSEIVPGSLSWATTLTGVPQDMVDTTTTDQTYAINDATGSRAGWHVSVTATPFTCTVLVTAPCVGTDTLPTTASGAANPTFSTNGDIGSPTTTTAPGDACSSGVSTDCTLPTNSTTYPVQVVTDGTTASTIFNAATGTGLGSVDIGPTTTNPALAPVGWWLHAPSDTVAGTYTSTITIDIVSGP